MVHCHLLSRPLPCTPGHPPHLSIHPFFPPFFVFHPYSIVHRPSFIGTRNQPPSATLARRSRDDANCPSVVRTGFGIAALSFRLACTFPSICCRGRRC